MDDIMEFANREAFRKWLNASKSRSCGTLPNPQRLQRSRLLAYIRTAGGA